MSVLCSQATFYDIKKDFSTLIKATISFFDIQTALTLREAQNMQLPSCRHFCCPDAGVISSVSL